MSLTPIHTSYLTTSALTAYLHHIHTAYIYLHSCHIYSPVPRALTAFGIKLLITALCGSLSRPQSLFCLELPCLALCWESNSSTTFAISCMHHVQEIYGEKERCFEHRKVEGSARLGILTKFLLLRIWRVKQSLMRLPDWLGNCNPSVSASQVFGLQVCATIPNSVANK